MCLLIVYRTKEFAAQNPMANTRIPIPKGYRLIPPDGGWGWMVLAGTSLIGMVVSLPLVAIGLMFNDIIYQLDTSATTTSWIPALTVSMAMFSAPFNAMIIDHWSCRISLIIGGIFCSLGLIISYFATMVETLFFSFGVCVGAGLGMSANTSYIVLSQYFTKHYGIATGISMASVATGKLIFSPLIQLMLERYGFRGVFLILGGLQLNIFVGAALCQPIKWHYVLAPIPPNNKTDVHERRTSLRTNNNYQTKSDLVKSGKSIEMKEFSNTGSKLTNKDEEAAHSLLTDNHQIERHVPSKMTAIQLGASWDAVFMEPVATKNTDLSNQSAETHKTNGCTVWLKNGPLKTLQFALLKEGVFYILLVSGLLGYITAVYSSIFMPPLAIEKGMESMQAATMQSIRSGTEIAGRLLAPWIMEKVKRMPLLLFYIGLNAAQGISLIVIVFMHTYASMTAFGAILGFFYGGSTGLSIVVIVDCVGADRLAAILGLTQFIQGFFTIGIGPFMGFMKDSTGSYDSCFIFMAVTQFILCGVWIIKPIFFKKANTNNYALPDS